VRKIFEKMSRYEAVELAARSGKDATTEAILLVSNTIDLKSFISWLEVGMKDSSVEINHNIKGNNHTFIIKHDLGENWTIYQKTVIESIFKEILRKRIDIITASSTTLTFKFQDVKEFPERTDR
jgi:hypothetical protein